MATATPLERAGLWGNLTFNYLTEIMAEGVYEQVLGYLGDPEVHQTIHRFLEDERHHAVGLRRHIAQVGPTIPVPLVNIFRDVSRAIGFGFAMRGTGAFMDHVHNLERLGIRWYGELSERFPSGSLEAERYRRYKAQEDIHRDWLADYQAASARDQLTGRVEAVEFASVVPAPIEKVFAFYTDVRSLPVIMGLPAYSPEGVTHFKQGDAFHIRLGPRPFEVEVDAHIARMDAPHYYVDRKTEVPFEHWEHHHFFTELGPNETLLSDKLLVRPKFVPPVPERLQPSPWKLALLLMLWWRHTRTQAAFRG